MVESLTQLLNTTKLIVNHQKTIEKLKGETFNVFSILKMERMETRTHTPFLAELLNPAGTHGKGNIFLKLFLDIIQYHKIECTKWLNHETASTCSNRYIGPVITEDGREQGGNLDIYIEDADKISITIENKIDESTEQNKQVIRYCNFNKGRNTVFYLTPSGTLPSDYSKGKLESGKHFFVLSYKHHIITWLKACLKESAEQPILRETIKQYIILIQKMTFSVNSCHVDPGFLHVDPPW